MCIDYGMLFCAVKVDLSSHTTFLADLRQKNRCYFPFPQL